MADKKISELDAVSSAARTDEFVVVQSGTTKRAALSDIDAVAEIGASQVTAGTLDDDRVAESNVTQHEAALSVAGSQVDSGTLPDARIQESGVTQHGTAALEVPWSNTVVVEGDNSSRATRATAVDSAIGEAGTAGKEFVFVPHEFLDYDASAVNFTKNSFSGRLVREGQVGDVYDVVAYGANRDGTGSQEAAIQAAIDAAPDDGATVFFPAGDYRVTTGIQIPTAATGFSKPVKIVGEGSGVSTPAGDGPSRIFLADDTVPALFDLDATGTDDFRGSFENLALVGPGPADDGTKAIFGGFMLGARFRNIKIRDFDVGMQIGNDCFYSVFEDCIFVNCFSNCVQIEGKVNGDAFIGCRFEGSGASGILLTDAGSPVAFYSCWFEDNTVAGLRVSDGIGAVNLYGCYFEKNTRHDIEVETGTGSPWVNLYGCHLFPLASDASIRAQHAVNLYGCSVLGTNNPGGVVENFGTPNVTAIGTQVRNGPVPLLEAAPSNFGEVVHFNDQAADDDADLGGGGDAYSLTNVTEDRTFDADSTTVTELADVVGTLISDLGYD